MDSSSGILSSATRVTLRRFKRLLVTAVSKDCQWLWRATAGRDRPHWCSCPLNRLYPDSAVPRL